jgi:hypothetical protein
MSVRPVPVSLVLAVVLLCRSALDAQCQLVFPVPTEGDGVVRLPTVVVTGTGFEQRAFDMPASFSSVEAETPRGFGARATFGVKTTCGVPLRRRCFKRWRRRPSASHERRSLATGGRAP